MKKILCVCFLLVAGSVGTANAKWTPGPWIQIPGTPAPTLTVTPSPTPTLEPTESTQPIEETQPAEITTPEPTLTPIPTIVPDGKEVVAFTNGWELYFKNRAKLTNGVCMIPLSEFLSAKWVGNSLEIDEAKGYADLFVNQKWIRFYLNSNQATVDGADRTLPEISYYTGDDVYVPIRFLTETLGGEVKVSSIDGKLFVDAIVTLKNQKAKEKEEFVFEKESKTDYLVWISKVDFETNLFRKSNGKWKLYKTYPCSIGAPATPTITGEWDYFSKEEKWFYPKYYVAPIMRFYSGYALHSTLIRYNGKDYDARLGKQISLGCIRLRPDDIEWLAENVPLFTKIYITE